MTTYPSSLPHPLKEGYSFEPENNILRTPMQSGRARQRQMFTSVPSYATLSWILDDTHARLFEAWSAQVAKADWFDMPLRTPLGTFNQQVRFMSSVSGPKRIGVRHWGYNVQVELRERAIAADGYAEILPDWILLSDIFDKAMNIEWPQYVFDYATYALALADVGNLIDGAIISIESDENNGGQHATYQAHIMPTTPTLALSFTFDQYGEGEYFENYLTLVETWP